MVGIIFMPVPYIIDGTTSHLRRLASYYHSTVHFNPSQSNKSSMHYKLCQNVINCIKRFQSRLSILTSGTYIDYFHEIELQMDHVL